MTTSTDHSGDWPERRVKSTFFRLLCGLEQLSRGRITIAGIDTGDMPRQMSTVAVGPWTYPASD